MAEVFETLSNHIRRIESLGKALEKPILISTEVESEVLTDWDDLNIEKKPIVWPLYQKNIFFEVTVPPGTTVPEHSHDEAIWRYLIEGSLVLNGEHEIKAGMWFVVNKDVPYEIVTKEGYKALSAYTSNCQTHHGSMETHKVKG